MEKKRKTKKLDKFLSIIVLIIVLLLVVFFINNKKNTKPNTLNRQIITQTPQFKTHTSENLKISFQYSSDWYIYDKNYDIFITSYPTTHRDGKKPTSHQIEIFIREGPVCGRMDLDQIIIIGGCYSEGKFVPHKIKSKEVKNLSSGIFYKYIRERFDTQDQTVYFLQNGDRILQISKEPDPSQFEKEFDEIINSITFL